jgi:hypothetical protein
LRQDGTPRSISNLIISLVYFVVSFSGSVGFGFNTGSNLGNECQPWPGCAQYPPGCIPAGALGAVLAQQQPVLADHYIRWFSVWAAYGGITGRDYVT